MRSVNEITSKIFGTLPEGTQVYEFILSNSGGVIVKIINYGGIITSILQPDINGNVVDVVLGFDDLEPYTKDSPYFGALIGRYGNRIDGGKFVLDGETVVLPQNDGTNNLHGGPQGFEKALWQPEVISTDAGPALKLSYVSPDGDQGFPGELAVTVVYQLTADNEFLVDYSAETNKTTVCNLTQHTYFNLAGRGDILGHQLTIHADSITPINEKLIPLADFMPVKDTAFDFVLGKKIGVDISLNHPQLKYAGGYDHNFVLNKTQTDGFELAASVVDYASGRVLKLYTTEPGLQFYSGNFLDGSLKGKGLTYKHRTGFCLEPQHFPNSPNRPDFPQTVLRPGEVYHSRMSFEFSTLSL